MLKSCVFLSPSELFLILRLHFCFQCPQGHASSKDVRSSRGAGTNGAWVSAGLAGRGNRGGEQHVAQTKLIKYINKMFDCTLAFGLFRFFSPLSDPPMSFLCLPARRRMTLSPDKGPSMRCYLSSVWDSQKNKTAKKKVDAYFSLKFGSLLSVFNYHIIFLKGYSHKRPFHMYSRTFLNLQISIKYI